MNIILREDERLDELNLNDLKIIQHKNKYTFTSDAVLLANFISAKNKDICLEIGSGSGVISTLLIAKQNPQKIVCFEIQQDLAEMSQRSIEYNNLQDKIEVINQPIQNCTQFYKPETFDIVFSNPPYKKLGSCFFNEKEEIAVCRHEKYLTLKELVQISSKMLKYKGKFYCVHEAERLTEIIYELRQNHLEPKKMFFTSPNQNKDANLVLIEAIKGGKSGVKILPTLIINEKNGNYTEVIQKIYRKN